ncbi:TetR family transcriptional regulator [Actinospica durhamensis]|uniref:TetR family transcriptional regulator n=1 Tax=Actinospica durhamensis TaxID=1508375 RepID=A0A941ITN4_9ACTN|nr:TetR family transcriptional regulator [Actinospica durhamensis]MBR7837837.1 TetR family transcriptional regulator [Actinospica durhamensis]
MTEDELPPRRARKLATRQALLDGALRLLEQQSLTSLGLREVTREAGIAPAAFYRHFGDLGELGVALVEESFGSLRALIRDIRTPEADTEDVIRRSVDLVAAHVRAHRAHFCFLARERYGGVASVRAAIAGELDSFVRELADDLAAQPESEGWSAPELSVLARLYVNVLMLTAASMIEAGPDDPAAEQSILTEALMQLRMITVGRRYWTENR